MILFRKIFVIVFILSIFVGTFHELEHHHHSPDDICEVCVVAHAPAVLNDSVVIVTIHRYLEPFYASFIFISDGVKVSLRSRSPPFIS
ncbi:MAG: hypothetical protein U9N33_01760 [Campylobacterota bacterium]|nr:hypothetical protein [Campylobacterota bacterium]